MVSCFCGVVNNTCKKMCIFSSISIKGWAVNNLELFSKNIRYAGLHLKKSFFQLRKVSASSCFSISIGPRYTYHFVILLRCCFLFFSKLLLVSLVVIYFQLWCVIIIFWMVAYQRRDACLGGNARGIHFGSVWRDIASSQVLDALVTSYWPLAGLSSQQTWWRLLEGYVFWNNQTLIIFTISISVTLNEGQGQYN